MVLLGMFFRILRMRGDTSFFHHSNKILPKRTSKTDLSGAVWTHYHRFFTSKIKNITLTFSKLKEK